MGLFNKRNKNSFEGVFENIDVEQLLEKHDKGLVDDNTFLLSFRNVKVFYSTPLGDHKDGGTRLFALPDGGKPGYLPVFTSMERIREFYDEAGRLGYLIMEGTFLSFLETASKMNKGNTPVKLGAVIDPKPYGVTIGASMLDTVIGMIK
jgi:hypothetical protein